MNKINKTLRNSILFAIFFSIFFAADFLLKKYVYDGNNLYDRVTNSTAMHDYKFIGVRSINHYSTTLLDFLNLNVATWINLLISFSIGGLLLILIMFTKSKIAVFGLSLMMAGLMGNSLDNLYYGYVKDMLYTPWFDRGTFNLADILLLVGLPFALIPMIVSVYK